MTSPRPCRACGETIPRSRRVDALYCGKKCADRYRSRKFDTANPDKVRANREKQLANTSARILTRVRHKCKKHDIPFDLDLWDIVVPTYCPILGHELIDRVGQSKGGNRNTISVDRKDPSKGYVKGNIGIISRRANLLKSNLTIGEVRKLLSYMEAASVDQ